MKHLDEEQLVAYRLGDLADAADATAIEEHLHACETCRRVLEQIDVALSAAASLQVPERPESYGAEVWARIAPGLGRQHAPGWLGRAGGDVRDGGADGWWARLVGFVAAPRRLALAGGLAVLVLAAFAAGRFWPHAQRPEGSIATRQQVVPSAAGAPDAKVRQQVLLVAVGDHLERSQMALMELVNAGNAARVDISDEQARARDLVAENRLYRQTAADTGETGVASVLDDLERVLVEVANSPSELPRADFERVKERIEAQGIIFKVRVLGERVRERETRAGTEI